MPVKFNIKYALLVSISLIGVMAVFLQGPIPQSITYHAFADARKFYDIPNFWNVLSNLPFIIVGFAGIWFTAPVIKTNSLALSCLVFFIGILFTGIGSSYYHLYPSNNTLVWDRLPMTISFMAFFSVIVGTCICKVLGQRLLFPLLFLGVLSVFYWQMTESRGQGDLRLYIIVQFLPVLLIPMILLLFKAPASLRIYFWLILLAYAIAKVFEVLDQETFHALHSLSGHSIKHLMAALAPLIFLIGLKRAEKL